MKALVCDGRVRLVVDHPEPEPKAGWAKVDVRLAGVCRTDLEVARGYMGFRGVMGHEFVGVVDGRRVVGEINAACGACDWCRQGLGRHCPNRTTLGIDRLDGALAERLTLPVENLHAVPDDVTDEEAVFMEPLAAAHEILEQAALPERARCVVMGDGKLGILCAWTLSTVCGDVTLVGRYPRKLERAQWNGVKTVLGAAGVEKGADVVVEATGRGQGLMESLSLVKPRGLLVLKSTVVSQGELNLALAVVNEVTVLGSRCGPFGRALKALRAFRFPVTRLIEARYPLDKGLEALERAARPGTMKVVVEMGR